MKKKAEMAVWTVLVFVLVTMMGCGGGSGSNIQSAPLGPADRPVVQSGLDQQPTSGPTGKVSLKMHVYDVESSSLSVKSAAKVILGGGMPIDYSLEYRKRVASIGLTFYDEVTGEWKYSFPFAVINGDVVAEMEGLIPGNYLMTGSAVSANGEFTFFSGETSVTVEAEKNNHAWLAMSPCSTTGARISVKDLPTTSPSDAQVTSAAANGDTISSQDSGYLYEGKFYFWTQVQLDPEPAIKLEYSVKDENGKIYIQEIGFNILDFIDNVIASGSYEIVYVPSSTNLTVDVIWSPAYTVSLGWTELSGVRPIVAGSTGVEMMAVDITTKKDPVAIQKIELGAVYSSSTHGISLVTIFDGSTMIGSGMFLNSSNASSTFLLTSSLQVSAYSTKTLTVKVDFALISSIGSIVNNVRLKYLSSSGVNEATGEAVEDKTLLSGQVTADTFKSLLKVSALPLPTTILQNGTNVLYRFADSADVAGDIDLLRKTFRLIRSAGVLTSNLRLMDEATGASTLLTDTNSGGEDGFNFEPIKTIAAGTQKSFALMAEVSGVVQGSWLATEMVGDQDAYKNLTAEQAVDPKFVGETNNNCIWSDRTKSPNSWHNGALIDGFPSSAVTLSK